MKFNYGNLERPGRSLISSVEGTQESPEDVEGSGDLGKKTTEIALRVMKPFSEEQTPKALPGKVSLGQMLDDFDLEVEDAIETKMQGWEELSTEEKSGVVRELLLGDSVFDKEFSLSERKEELRSKGDSYPELSDILQDPGLFSITEVKTGTLEEKPLISKKTSDSIENLKENDVKILKQNGKEISFEQLTFEREFRAINLTEVYEVVISNPEQQVVLQQFPKTKAWYIGAFPEENPLNSFQMDLLKIASQHKIIVISDGKEAGMEESKNFLYFQNDLRVPYDLPVPWARDAWDFSQGSEIRIPYCFTRDLKNVKEFLKEKRQERGWDVENLSLQTIGRSLTFFGNKKAINLANALEVSPILNLTYNEEGNTISGLNSLNEPFLLIGKDSYELSKESLHKTLGEELTDDDLKKAFGIDYGIEVKNIFFIEQPACFHLDMRMCALKGNKIALNDSVESLEKWKSIVKENISDSEYKELYQEALRFRDLEDKTQKDLEEQGFDVIRVGGHFFRETEVDCEGFNFFNLLTATTPDEKKIIVSLGFSDPSLEESLKKMLSDGEVTYDAIYFLDLDATGKSLFLDGGIKCRTKSIS